MISPAVSVIIPAYNHRDYILQTLESVFAQTFKNYEVIVVNDGSPDDTIQLLTPFIRSGQIRCIEQTNQGQAAARNRGLSEARGEFIAFLDDDDLWPADKLEWQLAYLTSNSAAGVIGGSVSIFSKATPSEYISIDTCRTVSLESCFESCPMSSPGQSMIRAGLLHRCGGLDSSIRCADDLDLWMRLAALTQIHMEDRLALYYRRHNSNASLNSERMLQNRLRVVRKNIGLVQASRRAEVLGKGLKTSYRNYGRKVITLAKIKLLKGHPGAACIHFAHFLNAFRWDLLRAEVAPFWLRDLVPVRLRHAASRCREHWTRGQSDPND